MNIPITAQLVIINKEGEVLCVSRKTDHNDFGLPGGKMEECDQENPKRTACRETAEETGIGVNTDELILVFAMHKYGSMSYTYLATDYLGEIEHDEPHVVKWGSFDDLMNGCFGKFNALVYESLIDMKAVENPIFTPEKITELNKNQNCNFLHPYTCDRKSEECEVHQKITETSSFKKDGVLIATTKGWICPCGKYKQNWAH